MYERMVNIILDIEKRTNSRTLNVEHCYVIVQEY
jgi:hypothetical protein